MAGLNRAKTPFNQAVMTKSGLANHKDMFSSNRCHAVSSVVISVTRFAH